MAAGADQLGPIPGKECARGLSDLGRMSHAPEADGTAFALIKQHPSHAEQADEEGRCELGIFRELRIPGCIPVREIERGKISDGKKQRDFRAEENPAIQVSHQRRPMRAEAGFSQRHGRDGGQCKKGEKDRESEDCPRTTRALAERHTPKILVRVVRNEAVDMHAVVVDLRSTETRQVSYDISDRTSRDLRVRLEEPRIRSAGQPP